MDKQSTPFSMTISRSGNTLECAYADSDGAIHRQSFTDEGDEWSTVDVIKAFVQKVCSTDKTEQLQVVQ